jgi:hypothetical protein
VRQSRTVPLSSAVLLVAVILTAGFVVPISGVSTAAAAPASFFSAFRDLPSTVQTGDILKVQVDAPDQAMCEGTIQYRDNSIEKLAAMKEADGRCRWDVLVPQLSRRGEADVSVTVKDGDNQATIRATVMVVIRSDAVGVALKTLPGEAKRGSGITINLDVPDKSSCVGGITYADGNVQSLDSQTEYKERCRWEVTVPQDVARGTARAGITVHMDGRSTSLWTSFDVDRSSKKAAVLAAFQDLPGNIRRDATLPVRVIVPDGARCSGEVPFRSAENIKLEETQEQDGVCHWSIVVPNDAKRGETSVKVTVKAGGDEMTLHGQINVDASSDDVEAAFKDLPNTIKRGDDLEIRVSLPDGATCQGDVTFDDGTVLQLEGQTEKKDRCLWSVRVPNYVPRGIAVVRILVVDQGFNTTLTGNVDVEGRGSEPISSAWESIPTSAERGDEFSVTVNATSGSTCSGRIDFADGMRWTLGTTEATDSRCRWRVQVPNHVGTGKAKAEVKIEKSGGSDTLKHELQITGSDRNTVAGNKPR